MKSAPQSSKTGQAKQKPDVKLTKAAEKSVHASTQNPDRAKKIIKAVYAGHVRGGHAFH
jgi:hypothetical protein